MVAMKDADGFKYFLSDHLGSVSLVLDDQGGILEQQRYLPFGEPRTMAPYADVTSTDFTYTGQRALPDTGLMDYRARFYSPSLKRFIQPDTIIPGAANPQSWNRYSYVGNSPINYADPSGHEHTEPIVYDMDRGCGGPGQESCLGNIPDNDEDIDGDKEHDDFPQCGYHHCPGDVVDLPDYEIGWQNFEQAWSIYWNPNATMLQRAGAGLYMGFWGGAHIILVASGVIILREGVIVVGAKLATQNPNATTVMLGRYYSQANSYLAQAGKQYTVFNLGRAYSFLDKIGLAKPINVQFINNQITKGKDFIVYGKEIITSNVYMETELILKTGLYYETGPVGQTLYSNFIQLIP